MITKAISKQLSWVQASEILGISVRHVRRLRRKLERWGVSAVMDQRGGRPRRKRLQASTLKMSRGDPRMFRTDLTTPVPPQS